MSPPKQTDGACMGAMMCQCETCPNCGMDMISDLFSCDECGHQFHHFCIEWHQTSCKRVHRADMLRLFHWYDGAQGW